MISRGPLAGTEVALVVQVDAIGNGVEAASLPKVFHQREEFIFTEEAALGIVADVFRAIKFGGGDHFQGDRLFLGKGDCIGKLGARQAGRVGDDGQHSISQHLMSSPREVGRINSAGVGD